MIHLDDMRVLEAWRRIRHLRQSQRRNEGSRVGEYLDQLGGPRPCGRGFKVRVY